MVANFSKGEEVKIVGTRHFTPAVGKVGTIVSFLDYPGYPQYCVRIGKRAMHFYPNELEKVGTK